MSRRARRWTWVAAGIAIVVAVAWRYQSEIIGTGFQRYLRFVASREEHSGDVTQRRQTIARIHRQLLIEPPADAMVPELFDFLTQLSARTATGEISLAWSAYLYTTHWRAAVGRPPDEPRPTDAQLAAEVQQGVEFYYLQKRPDIDGARVKDLWDDGDSFTLEEIEQAHREGRDLTRED